MPSETAAGYVRASVVLFDDPQLSPTARVAIASPENQVVVSSASGWEIATKFRLGKLPEAGDVAPGPHRDPLDRMLIAQARVEDMPIATNDPVFRDYGARIVW